MHGRLRKKKKATFGPFKPPGTLARRRLFGSRRAPAVSHVQPFQADMNLIDLFYWLASPRCNRHPIARLQAHFLQAARGFASGGSKNPASTLLCKSNATCQSAWQRRQSRVPHDAWPTRRTTVFVGSQKRNCWLSCFSRQRQYFVDTCKSVGGVGLEGKPKGHYTWSVGRALSHCSSPPANANPHARRS